MTERLVRCVKFQEELPGLEKPPFAGDLGKRIFEQVSQKAWSLWRNDMQIKVLNEYRLNMGDPRDYQVLMQEMMKFLNLQDGKALEVENAERGKGGQ